MRDRLAAAQKAVALACSVTRTVQRDLERVRALTKDDQSPVTIADLASQAIVARTLQQELGGELRLVAEEDAEALKSDAELAAEVCNALQPVWPRAFAADVIAAIDRGRSDGTGSFFTLDPIDGTKGFLRNEQYAVSLGYIENGAVTMGVLGCPNLSFGTMYASIRGTGFSVDGSPAQREHHDGLILVESVEAAHSKHDSTKAVMEKLGEPYRSERLDSQAKYATLARGKGDIYLRMPAKKGYVEKIWDHAAGALIATEAGLVVSDVRGNPLDFSRGRTLSANLGVVAAPPALHARLVRVIAELGLDREPS